MAQTKEINLRAVIFKSGEVWIGQCLELDIAAQARDPRELPYQLERAIIGHIVIAEENQLQPFKNVPAAPKRYWHMFERGLKMQVPTQHRFAAHGQSRAVPMPEVYSLSDLVPA